MVSYLGFDKLLLIGNNLLFVQFIELFSSVFFVLQRVLMYMPGQLIAVLQS